MAQKTEHGGSIAFATSGGSHCIESIQGHKETGDVVEITCLDETGKRKYEPGDLTGLESFDVVIRHQNTAALPAQYLKQTVTITWPLASGESTAGSVAGEAFVKDIKYPNQTAGSTTLRTSVLTVQWTGATGPSVTNAS